MKNILDFKSFNKQDLSILFVGDIMCTDKESATILSGNDPFIHLRGFFDQFDLRMGNLETTFSGTVSGFPRFSSTDKFADILQEYFDVVFLANNHCFDFGYRGLNRTINVLDKYETYHVGTGTKKSLSLSVNGHDITILNYTIDVNGEERTDTEQSGIFFHKLNPEEDKKGLINFYSQTKAEEEIDTAKTKSEIVIIGIHGGPEYSRTPKEKQTERLLELIRMGGNVVLGGHPHVFAGGFQRGNDFSTFSLGNFFSDQEKLDVDAGCIMCTRIDSFGNYTYSFLPVLTYLHPQYGHKVLPLYLIEQGYYNFISNDDRADILKALDKIRKTMREQGLTEEPFPMHLAR
jgi:poly-gamma-glutamate synthesis protein (capsule biosynthesis protein)